MGVNSDKPNTERRSYPTSPEKLLKCKERTLYQSPTMESVESCEVNNDKYKRYTVKLRHINLANIFSFKNLLFLMLFFQFWGCGQCKYVEGEIKTKQVSLEFAVLIQIFI